MRILLSGSFTSFHTRHSCSWDIACLDRVGLRPNGEHEVDNVGERDVSRVRPVPAAPADVITNAIFGQSAKRVIERINTHPAKFLELLKRWLGIDHVPVVG